MDMIALSTIFKDGERYSPGAKVPGVSDADAEVLKAGGHAKEFVPEKKAETKAEKASREKSEKEAAEAAAKAAAEAELRDNCIAAITPSDTSQMMASPVMMRRIGLPSRCGVATLPALDPIGPPPVSIGNYPDA